jgi:tetratricopeptide (TPR) repeat protein
VADSLSATNPLVQAITELLTESGPMATHQLIAALAGRRVDLGDDPDEVLEEALDDGEGVITVLADDRWASLPALLTGRVFTHQMSEPEIEHDILHSNPDLEPLTMLIECEEHERLVDGSVVRRVLLPFDADALIERGVPLDAISDHGALLFPPGYLTSKGVSEGDVITLGLTRDGLVLDLAPSHEAHPETLDRLGARLTAILEDSPSEPTQLDIAVWTACADDPAVFTEPLPPLGVVLDTCGLTHDGGWLAGPGFDFAQWRTEKRCAMIARQYKLTDHEALAVLAIALLYEHLELMMQAAALDTLTDQRQPSPADPDRAHGADIGDRVATVQETLEFLAKPAVAEAVLAETIGSGTEGAAVLGLFAEALEPHAPRAARPALLWLLGKANQRLGELSEAEAAYQAAESLDPQWPPALVELAQFASDRGDAARGLALLRRAGFPPDHEFITLLEHFQAMPRPGLGRNQPCWCGSGRKYKTCHLRNEQLPLDERAVWLYQKAIMFVVEGPWRAAMAQTAQVRAQYAENPDALLHALCEPLVIDAVLFEGGAFAEFMSVRGMLLPDDERSLAEQWLLVDRSVYEVERVRRGAGFRMRDLRTGDIHEVQERTASQTVTAGALVCTHILPAGDTKQIFGGIEPVALHQRDELIALLDSEPDPLDLVAFLSRRLAPPVLRNAEDEPLVLCTATLRVDDPAALTAALDETYQRDDSGDLEWFEHVTVDGGEFIRATLSLDGNELIINTNSEARIDRVLDTLHALEVRLTVVGQSRQPARDAREAAALTTRTAPPDEDTTHQLDPAVAAAALDQFIRDYERRWLDEPIPALAGHTPRQAAADPTRRGDLARLLDCLPSHHDNPATMDPERLRTALDLR